MHSIAVEIISEATYRTLGAAPDQDQRLPAGRELAAAPDPAGEAAAPDPPPSAIEATTLLSGAILAAPENRAVRETLPTLAPFERMVQLCNIEAVEQIRLAQPGSHPDTVAAESFALPEVRNGVLVATGAAYRSEREWYRLSFTCEPRADLLAVTAFTLELGDRVPREDWDEHNLIAEDADD